MLRNIAHASYLMSEVPTTLTPGVHNVPEGVSAVEPLHPRLGGRGDLRPGAQGAAVAGIGAEFRGQAVVVGVGPAVVVVVVASTMTSTSCDCCCFRQLVEAMEVGVT